MNSIEILTNVKNILRSSWQHTEAKQVPDIEKVALKGNHGVNLDATILYADMADSTKLVDRFKTDFAAEVYKSFLLAACRIIRTENGTVTAFDGDRVMAVYTGNLKNTQAVTSALKIHYIVRQINAAILECYPNTSYSLSHTVGIDSGKVMAAKTGIPYYNDLVWVGSAANYAAKLSAFDDPGYPTYISEAVYKAISDSAKFGGNPKEDMWEKRSWTTTGKTVYRSSYWWAF